MDIVLFELVRRRATRLIVQDSSLDYKEHLSLLEILPLMMYFERADLVLYVNPFQNLRYQQLCLISNIQKERNYVRQVEAHPIKNKYSWPLLFLLATTIVGSASSNQSRTANLYNISIAVKTVLFSLYHSFPIDSTPTIHFISHVTALNVHTSKYHK